jgi:hypothetical protein
VVGSFGALSHTSAPHSASPHLLMRTPLSLPSVYQVPRGSAVRARDHVRRDRREHDGRKPERGRCPSGYPHRWRSPVCKIERIKAAARKAVLSRRAGGYFRLIFAPDCCNFPRAMRVRAQTAHGMTRPIPRIRFRVHSSHCLNYHSNLPMMIGVSVEDKKKPPEPRRRTGP